MTPPCLVIPPTRLPEALYALPALDALAASGRRLVIPAAPPLGGIYKMSPARPDVLLLESTPGELVGRTRAAACPQAVVLDASLGGAWLTRTVDVPERWGYAGWRSGWLGGGWLRSMALNRPVAKPRLGGRHVHDDYRELLAAVGAPPPATTRLVIPDELRAKARERLERARLDPADPLLGVYAGVDGGFGRPWPRRSFEELLRALRRETPRRGFALFAAPRDLWVAVRLHEETGKIHPVLGPDLSLDLFAAVLAELDLVLAGDSWILHLAAAVGTPTIGLFSRDPARWAPRGDEHIALAQPHLAKLEVEALSKLVGEHWTELFEEREGRDGADESATDAKE